MKLYAVWQPVVSEDACTALVFGFLRHAPVDEGLQPWLAGVLGRPVDVAPLEAESFWPRYQSHLPGHTWTEPEIVFEADDGEPLVVVVEAKPGYGMHRQEQLVREAIDVAHGEDARRIAVIAIGADMGTPAEFEAWSSAARDELAAHGRDGTQFELHYSAWADLAAAIERSAAESGSFQHYAHDVVTQLRLNALLGYEGAPMLDDLDEMNLRNAFLAFNRAMVSARKFFLTLHDQSGFRQTGLQPFGNQGYRMVRNGASTALRQHEDAFQVSTAMCYYRKPSWEPDFAAFATFFFAVDADPHLQVGAVAGSGVTDLHWDHDWLDDSEELRDPRLLALDKAEMPYAAADPKKELTFDQRPWLPNSGAADVSWAVEKLTVIADALD